MLLCSCRPLRSVLPLRLSRPSRPLPAPGPGEPPEQQSPEAEADRVQEEDLAVAGQQQRGDHQQRNRRPLSPPQEPAEADRDSPDLWNRCLDVLDLHLHLLACCCPHRHPERGSRLIASLTMDTLRPRSDAKRGSGAWLEPGPPASRTQRGQGRRRRSSARVFSVGIDCWELLRSEAAVLRGGHGTAHVEKDTARPGSTLGSDAWGNCGDVEAASLRRDLRPARVEAAVSRSQLHRRHERPVEATDALRPGCRGRDAGRTSTRALRTKRTKRRTHSGQGIPTSEAAFRRARLNPSDHLSQRGKRASLRGDRWESKAQSFRSTPLGGCSESRARSYAAGPGFGGRESSRFLGRETLEKPDNDLSITPHLRVGKGFGASPAKVFNPVQSGYTKLQIKFGKRRPDPESRYLRHRPRVRTRRSSSRFARALRVS